MRRRSIFEGRWSAPHGATVDKLALARAMRKRPTRGEAILWAALRRRAVNGFKFRRQAIVAGYILDFYCCELRLAIEVDGGAHERRSDEDAHRDRALTMLGVNVIRVRDEDVQWRRDEIVAQIEAATTSQRHSP